MPCFFCCCHRETVIQLYGFEMSRCTLADPCLTYTEKDEPHRSIDYVVNSGFSCDNTLQPGWYRFTAHTGGKMAETCQTFGHCGTRTPIWLNGTHPDDYNIHTMVACTSYGPGSLCCGTQVPVQVKKCPGGYYVYNLQPTYGCPSGYCVGSGAPCPPGETYNFFHRQCGDLTPPLTDRPVLHNPVIDEHYKVVYKCEIQYATPEDGAEFEVAFLFDGELYPDVPNRTVSGNPLIAHLDAWHLGENSFLVYTTNPPTRQIIWQSKMGKEITCAVRANWNGKEEKTDWIASEPKWAGVQIEAHHLINLPQAQVSTYELHFHSTVPFTCFNLEDFDHDCSIEIPFSLGNAVAPSSCSLTIKANSWDGVEQKAVGEIVHMTAVKDQGQSSQTQVLSIAFGTVKTQERFFHQLGFESSNNGLVPHLFTGYTPDTTIQVRVEDAREQECTSSGDPHIRTFDGGPRAENIAHGDFVLYRSTVRVFEVQSRHWHCNSVTCNCGVAVREANDVVIIDMCQSEYGFAHPTLSYKTATGGPLSHAVAIDRGRNGKKFKVSMPSGAYIIADAYSTSMSITVHAPGVDFGHTEGLCGFWDGDSTNDLRMRDGSLSPPHTWRDWHHEYSESWRVQGASLFNAECFTPTNNHPPDVEYCDCSGGNNLNCDFTKLVNKNNVNNLQPENYEELRRASGNIQCARRRKRDVTDIRSDPELYTDDLNELDIYDFVPDLNFSPVVNDWPTPNFGITEDQARDICQEAVMNLTVATACRDVLGIDIFSKVGSCMADIQVTEDLAYALSSADEIEEKCSEVAYQNVSLYEVNEDGVAVPPTIITSQLCPRQCSQRGGCVNGTCHCNEGFTSADCSLQVGRAPQALFLPAKGLCDIRHRPCMKATFLANGLIDSENLTCRVTQVQMRHGIKQVQQDTTGQTAGRLLSSGEVSCHLPRTPVAHGTPAEREGEVVHGMMLSVSNDGQVFSRELLFTVYDSVCQECFEGGNCIWKPDTCIIRGHCFASGEANPNNWCQQCLPLSSNNTWTERPVNRPPRFNSPSTITKVAGENLTLTIGAVDPEGRPVTFSLEYSSPANNGILLQPNGDLLWYGHGVASFSILINITDECGASAQQMFQFQIMDCPCQHDGVCVPDASRPRGQGFYTCDCPGFTGQYCETEVDECGSSPCTNGTCIDLVNGYNCTCNAGSTGPNCDISITDLCALGACYPGVSCINLDDGQVRCGRCPSGYFGNGHICEDIDECADASYGCNYVCQNVPGSYRCTCQPGYLLVEPDCIDLDECLYGVSECSHTCINTNGSYTCDCPDGWTLGSNGKTCLDVDECASSPCLHGGQCRNGANKYTCDCPRGWIGQTCEEDIDECVVTNHGCEHQCENTAGSYGCACPEGYVVGGDGKSCQDYDECSADANLCSQLCVNTEGNYTCRCYLGFILGPDGSCIQASTQGTDAPQTESSSTQAAHGTPTVQSLSTHAAHGTQTASESDHPSSSPTPGSTKQPTEKPLLTTSNTGSSASLLSTAPDSPSLSPTPGSTKQPTEKPVLTTSKTAVDDCRVHPCPDEDHQDCVEMEGTYVCQCVKGYYLSEGGTQCKESEGYHSELTISHLDGREALFTDNTFGDPESEVYKTTARAVEDAIDATFSLHTLKRSYKGCSVTGFQPGSVIAIFELYFDESVQTTQIIDILNTGISGNNSLGSNGAIVVVPSSLLVTEIVSPKSDTPWYQEPLYISLLCVGLAVVVTLAVVVIVVLTVRKKSRFQCVPSKLEVDNPLHMEMKEQKASDNFYM